MTRFQMTICLLTLCAGVSIACAQNDIQTLPAEAGQRAASASAGAQTPAAPRTPDVPYVPTPPEVVDMMLKIANVTKNDVVYDLGCGDGRIVIAAAQEYGARGVGVDIDPQRIKEARDNAQKAGVTDRVKFLQQDFFATEIGEATVVTLYLLPAINLKLRPKLFQELKPGTRVVSHNFDMGDWRPEKTVDVNGRKVYYWVIPAPAGAAKK